MLQEDTEPTEEQSNAQTCSNKKDKQSGDVTISPKKRSSITAQSINSVEGHLVLQQPDGSVDVSDSASAAVSAPTPPSAMQHQTSLDQSVIQGVKSAIANLDFSTTTETEEIVAEPLEKILESKPIKEKRDALEKKLKSLRKTHEKEKLKVSMQLKNSEGDAFKKTKFYMSNKLVKRLSSKNM